MICYIDFKHDQFLQGEEATKVTKDVFLEIFHKISGQLFLKVKYG